MDKLLEFGAQLLPNFGALLFPNLKEKTETLQNTIDFLKCRKRDVDHELQNAACHSGKKRKSVVEDWENNVENIIKDFENSKQGVQQSSRFYHVFKRQRLAEELERISKKATELDARSKFANGLFLGVEESTDPLSLIPRSNGQAFQLSVEVSGICKEMVKRCDGLPLALITMAGSMRGVTDIHGWRNASEELKESCLGRADMEDEVLPILRIADAEKIKMASGRPGSCNTTIKLWEKIHLGHVMLHDFGYKKGSSSTPVFEQKKSNNPSSISRKEVWTSAHIKKNDEPICTCKLVEETLEKLKGASQHDSNANIKEDALSKVLGPENSGGLRGIGGGVCYTKYSILTQMESNIAHVKVQVADMERTINELLKKQEKQSEEVSNIQLSSSLSVNTNTLNNKCKLLDWTGTGEEVAEGRWSSNDPKILVHRIPLGPNAVRVWVDVALKPDAFLWRPTSYMTCIKECVGTTIAWPCDKVVIE